jgi:uncharacterized protein (TIGR02246 family)
MSAKTEDKSLIEDVLDRFHKSASDADAETYFDLFATDGYFMGTDANERWSVSEFREYAMPFFRQQGKGWTYRPIQRHVCLSNEKNVAWFDEILQNDRFGTARSSGVLIQENQSWKVAQYHLTIPVPNDLMDTVVQLIRENKDP